MMKRFLWLFLDIKKYIAIVLNLGEQGGQNCVTLMIHNHVIKLKEQDKFHASSTW